MTKEEIFYNVDDVYYKHYEYNGGAMYEYGEPPKGEKVWWLKVVKPLSADSMQEVNLEDSKMIPGDTTWIGEKYIKGTKIFLIENNRYYENFHKDCFEVLYLAETFTREEAISIPEPVDAVYLEVVEDVQKLRIGDVIYTPRKAWENEHDFIKLAGDPNSYHKSRFKLLGEEAVESEKVECNPTPSEETQKLRDKYVLSDMKWGVSESKQWYDTAEAIALSNWQRGRVRSYSPSIANFWRQEEGAISKINEGRVAHYKNMKAILFESANPTIGKDPDFTPMNNIE